MTTETTNRVLEALYRATAEVNEALPANRRLAPGPATAIAGPGATLDSVGFINLLVAAEQELVQAFGRPVSLTDLVASSAPAEYSTIAALSALVAAHLDGTSR